MTAATSQPTLSFPRETFAKLSPHPYLLANLRPASASSVAPSLSPSTRANGRTPTQFRPPHINTGSLTHAEGSAVVRIGDTTVVCGIRGEILLASNVAGYRVDQSMTTPSSTPGYNEAKELDLLVPNIELATGCSPGFLPGQPPSLSAQSLSTRIHSLLHSSGLVDAENFRIWYQPPDLGDQDWVADHRDNEAPKPEVKAFWTLYIDILFISLDGNAFDAAWAALVAALKDVRLPMAYWDLDREMILCDESVARSRKLQLRGLPIAVTAVVATAGESTDPKHKRYWTLVDPDAFEEDLCDEILTVIVDCDNGKTKLLGVSKTGGMIVGRNELRYIVGLAEKRFVELRNILGQA